MRTRDIWADTIDEAAEYILGVLKRSIGSRDNVFYFDGWDGLGASAVLRAVAQRLKTTSPAGLEFERVIHIDCSKWESRRALQRAVAEQLDLPAEVMEMFDKEDEEDDFRGVAQGSRVEVQQIVRVMQQQIQTRRLLVIFHNGSSEEVDLASCCGFPLSGYSTSKVLWTFRFQLKPRMKVKTAMKSAGTTDVFISSYLHNKKQEDHWSYLVLQEAVEVVAACKVNVGFHGIIHEPAQVAECFQYMLELCCRGSHWIDYDWNTHGANYWVCDGIIHQPQQWERNVSAGDDDDDGLWRSAEALHCEMPLDVDYHQYLPAPHLLTRFVGSNPYLSSPTCGFTRIPDGSTPIGNMFQNYLDQLRVLKLSRCTFSFQSPPFISCHSLRFLWLDHCQVTGSNTDEEGKEEDIRRCFQRLWVLDIRSTDCGHILSARMLDLMTQLKELIVMGANDWDIGQLQGRLPNIRKLRVKNNSGVRCSCPENDLFSGMDKMELLEFSGNGIIYSMRGLSGPGAITNCSCLETVIIADGFYLSEMSFRGCTRLENLLLRGWVGVSTLDISGTAVKTLDLTATQIRYLDEIYLLGCEKLCAITWPPKDVMSKDLSKLCIDTTQSAPTAQSRNEKDKKGTTATTSGTSVAASVSHDTRPTSEFDWHISVRDARLLKSLEPVYSDSRKIHVEVSSPTISAGGSKDQGIKSGSSHEQVNLRRHPAPAVYGDITVDHLQQQACEDGDGDAGDTMGIWPCPDVPRLPQKSCYMHIQDRMMRTELLPRGGGQTSGTITVPWFVSRDNAKILHVHDSMSITSTPSYEYGSEWPNLEWCRIERCPKLEYIFNNNNDVGDVLTYQLRTFWASQLLKSHYISTSNGYREFPNLTFLHLDLCPRLIHVLPLKNWVHRPEDSFRLLETLEIIWCGDLKVIFPLHTSDDSKSITREFINLKHIHLHELPSLQRICGGRMLAPNLETVKIRGCWSLTCLPNVGDSNKMVECDCEKDWWDKLEWDDRSQATHYKPIHPRYYKKTVLRSTVLR